MLFKRIFDIFVSIIGLIILSPLFVILAILIKITTPGPIFFRQDRVGKDGVIFSIYKFRSMIDNASGAEITIGNDKRITKVGEVLRTFKLDELPQLINVLSGDMSVVGPRPEVPSYVKLYPHEIRQIVLSIRPGITDWASILMINENQLLAKSIDPEATYIDKIMPCKLAFAVKYVKTRTFWQDCLIILNTLKKICCR